MKIIVTGSLGNISKPLTEILAKSGHHITVISSNKNKTKDIEAIGANAAVGSVTDINFLTETFKGADAVYTMVPPNFATADMKGFIAGVGKNYAEALKNSEVKKVVNLSSIGAHLSSGTGPITGLHRAENYLNELPTTAVIHLRPAYFYFNFFANISLIKNMGVFGSNNSSDKLFVMVHPNDIAVAAARELQNSFTGKKIEYVIGDERISSDIASVLGQAIGKPDLRWVGFSDEQALAGMTQAGLPEEIAKNYVEMGQAINSGVLWEHYQQNKPATYGKIKLEDFAVEFAAAYNNA